MIEKDVMHKVVTRARFAYYMDSNGPLPAVSTTYLLAMARCTEPAVHAAEERIFEMRLAADAKYGCDYATYKKAFAEMQKAAIDKLGRAIFEASNLALAAGKVSVAIKLGEALAALGESK